MFENIKSLLSKKDRKIFGHYDGHGVLSSKVAQIMLGGKIICKFPKTGPNNWEYIAENIEEGDIVIDIAPDARNPESMKELLSEMPPFIWIDEHPADPDIIRIAKARGIAMFHTSSSLLTSLMPIMLRAVHPNPPKIDNQKFEMALRLARIAAICDRDRTVTNVSNDELAIANGFDVLVRRYKGYDPALEEYIENPRKAMFVEGGPQVPQNVHFFIRKHYIVAKDPLPGEGGFALKDMELVLMAKQIPLGILHYPVPRFGTWNVAVMKAVYVKGINIIPLVQDKISEEYGSKYTILNRDTLIQVIGIPSQEEAYRIMKKVEAIVDSVFSPGNIVISKKELEEIVREAVAEALKMA